MLAILESICVSALCTFLCCALSTCAQSGFHWHSFFKYLLVSFAKIILLSVWPHNYSAMCKSSWFFFCFWPSVPSQPISKGKLFYRLLGLFSPDLSSRKRFAFVSYSDSHEYFTACCFTTIHLGSGLYILFFNFGMAWLSSFSFCLHKTFFVLSFPSFFPFISICRSYFIHIIAMNFSTIPNPFDQLKPRNVIGFGQKDSQKRNIILYAVDRADIKQKIRTPNRNKTAFKLHLVMNSLCSSFWAVNPNAY